MNPEELANADGLMLRSFPAEYRATATAKREFTGIGVPYGETYDLGYGLYERFEPGAIDLTGTKIFWQHREVIGTATAGQDTDAGFEVTGKISDTTLGRDAWTLLEDGAVDSLSIGFKPVDYRTETDDDGNTTIIHTKVDTREFSLVDYPAYTEAKVSAIRSALTTRSAITPTKGTTMDTETLTRDDLAPITAQLTEMERGLALVNSRSTGPADPVAGLARLGSVGGLLRALATGDEDAATQFRAFTDAVAGGKLSDSVVKDSWVGNFIKLATARRKVIADFGGTATLPSEGMNVEYGKLKSDTTAVAKQAAEADDLAFGKIELTTATAPISTYGGWTALSRQVIERSSVPYLDTLWEAMGLRYARVTEKAVRDYYAALIAAKVASADPNATVPLPALFDTTDVLDSIVDLAEIFDDRGYAMSGLHVSKDVFKKFNALTDGDSTRLMTVYGNGVNQVGSLDLSGLSGNIANLSVRVLPGAAANTAVAYDPVAVKVWENPGAPLRLQDENIVNLTKDFSLYGYLAVGNPHPDAIVPLEIAAG